jgi:hypothetical protein
MACAHSVERKSSKGDLSGFEKYLFDFYDARHLVYKTLLSGNSNIALSVRKCEKTPLPGFVFGGSFIP